MWDTDSFNLGKPAIAAMHGPLVWSDSVILRVVSIRSGTQIVTNDKITRRFFKIDKSWFDYRVLTNIGLLANTDGPCNLEI